MPNAPWPWLDRAVEATALIGGMILLLIIGVTVTNTGLFIADRIASLAGQNVSGLSGYEDFVGLATGTAVLLLLPYCQHRRGHLSVDILAHRLPVRLNRVLASLWLVLMGIAVFALGVALFYGMLELRSDQAVSRVLGWPVWPFLGPGVIALILWAAVAIRQFWASLGRDHQRP